MATKNSMWSLLFDRRTIHPHTNTALAAAVQGSDTSDDALTSAGLPGGGDVNDGNEREDTTEAAWDVDLYQSQHSFVWRYGESLLDMLDIEAGMTTVLDLGCGSGELTSSISERGAKTIGIDADRDMIARARERFPALDFRVGDARNFSLGDDVVVDAIISNAALHWVQPPEDAVVSMSRALKPGGRAVLEFGGRGNIAQIVSAIEQVVGKDDERSRNPWYFPSISEYSQLLEKHGMEVIHATLVDRPTPLEGGERGMVDWMTMFARTVGFFDGIEDEDDVKAGMEKAADLLRPTQFDGHTWTADYRRIRIVAIRR